MEYEKYKEAGKIARDALKKGLGMVKEGVKYKDVAEDVEEYIKERAGIAFPVNISVNSVAAHYTPSFHDEKVFQKGDVVKIDVGAHVDGYIGDTAKTIEIGTKNFEKLIESAEKALEEAIKIVKAGVKIGEIGRKIEDKIKEYGYKPVKNLYGHSLAKYNLHAGISIPNLYVKSPVTLKEGQVIAIEPFSTNGAGVVIDDGLGNIYRISRSSSLLKEVKSRFHSLPFAERWFYEIYGNKAPLKLSFFMKRKLIAPYFKLVDAKNGIVAQAEHTVMVKDDGCEILTA